MRFNWLSSQNKTSGTVTSLELAAQLSEFKPPTPGALWGSWTFPFILHLSVSNHLSEECRSPTALQADFWIYNIHNKLDFVQIFPVNYPPGAPNCSAWNCFTQPTIRLNAQTSTLPRRGEGGGGVGRRLSGCSAAAFVAEQHFSARAAHGAGPPGPFWTLPAARPLWVCARKPYVAVLLLRDRGWRFVGIH